MKNAMTLKVRTDKQKRKALKNHSPFSSPLSLSNTTEDVFDRVGWVVKSVSGK